MTVQKNTTGAGESSGTGAAFVKVSVDGAPYLRKVDLKMYKSYQQLSDALGKMFSSFTIGKYWDFLRFDSNIIKSSLIVWKVKIKEFENH